MLVKAKVIIPPRKITPMNVKQPLGLVMIRAQHFGQVSVFELTSVPHSLHFMNVITIFFFNKWKMSDLMYIHHFCRITPNIDV